MNKNEEAEDEEFEVSPWDVKGKVNYDKLIEKFGTKKINKKTKNRMKKHTGDLHKFFKRDFFFSHRDFDKVLDDYEDGNDFFLYTGRGPSGPMHIGHISSFVATKWLQEKFDVNLYIQITDDEKFLFKDLELDDTKKWAKDNILDIIALGFDPDKTFIFQDSEFTQIYDMALEISKKVNFSEARSVFGFENKTNLGSIFYPAIQAAPTFFEKRRCLIPAAIDQDPYWRIQRDYAETLGYYKVAAVHSKFFPSLTGMSGKMSSSKEKTAIYLDDEEEEVKEKINKNAYTGGRPTAKEQRNKGGKPEICVVFKWFKILFDDDRDELRERFMNCKNGDILCGECKAELIEDVSEFLKDHQKKKEKAKDKIDEFKYNGDLAEKQWNKALPEELKGN